MSTNKFQNKYRIPSARAAWHDYSGGMYFITICTAEREHYFGKIENDRMIYTEIGEYTDGCINDVPNHYPDAKIELYQIMPNHVHLIIGIDPYYAVETVHAPPLHAPPLHAPPLRQNINKKMQEISKSKGRLSKAVGSMKSAVTRYANDNNIPFKWQTRFHDRIIRDQEEFNRIAEYIINNPKKWDTDIHNNLKP